MSRPENDARLVEGALRGDRHAFGELVERHLRPAFGIAYALTGSADDGEDVVQEAFLRAYRGLSQLQRGNFGPWLGGIVRHLAADLQRTLERRERAGEVLQHQSRETSASGPDGGAMDRDEDSRLVREELAALPEELRLPLVLFYFEGQSTERVAARLGLRPATARKRMQLAREQLRGRLPRVPPGEYHLQVQSAGWTMVTHQKLSWSADGAPVEVVLRRR